MDKMKFAQVAGNQAAQVEDTVEIVSDSVEELHGKVCTILQIKGGEESSNLRLMTQEGDEIWLDAREVAIY